MHFKTESVTILDYMHITLNIRTDSLVQTVQTQIKLFKEVWPRSALFVIHKAINHILEISHINIK